VPRSDLRTTELMRMATNTSTMSPNPIITTSIIGRAIPDEPSSGMDVVDVSFNVEFVVATEVVALAVVEVARATPITQARTKNFIGLQKSKFFQHLRK
jgi:hypothetical protein